MFIKASSKLYHNCIRNCTFTHIHNTYATERKKAKHQTEQCRAASVWTCVTASAGVKVGVLGRWGPPRHTFITSTFPSILSQRLMCAARPPGRLRLITRVIQGSSCSSSWHPVYVSTPPGRERAGRGRGGGGLITVESWNPANPKRETCTRRRTAFLFSSLGPEGGTWQIPAHLLSGKSSFELKL